MQASKLIDYLKALDSSELRKFRKFISSEYHNTNEKVVRLFDFLRKHHPEFDSPRLKKESVIKKLFPEFKKDGVKKFSYVTSDMFKLLEDFMIDQELERDEVVRQRVYVSALNRRLLYKQALVKAEKERELLMTKKPIDHNHYYDVYRFNEMIFVLGEQEEYIGDNNRLALLMEELDTFYFTAKMRYGLVMMNREAVLSESYSILLLEEILGLLKAPPFSENILLNTYVGMRTLMVEGDSTIGVNSFFQLKELYFNHLESYEEGEKIDIGVMLLNYAHQMMLRGKGEFKEELWELYDLIIRRRIFVGSHLNMALIFFNAIQFSSELGKLDWAGEMLDEEIDVVPEEQLEETHAICKAYWYCCKKNFDEALVILRDTHFENFHYLLTARYLTFRSYFEEENDYAFFNFSKTFKAYIRRHTQMSEALKERNLNFIKFTELLFQSKIDPVKYNKTYLTNKLSAMPQIAYRTWILKQLKVIKEIK